VNKWLIILQCKIFIFWISKFLIQKCIYLLVCENQQLLFSNFLFNLTVKEIIASTIVELQKKFQNKSCIVPSLFNFFCLSPCLHSFTHCLTITIYLAIDSQTFYFFYICHHLLIVLQSPFNLTVKEIIASTIVELQKKFQNKSCCFLPR
jgi:hypothetical protein